LPSGLVSKQQKEEEKMARSGTPPPNHHRRSGGGGSDSTPTTNNHSGDTRKSRPHDQQQSMTLFQRMGGINAVKAVVDEFYSRIQQDGRVQLFFLAISMAHLKRHQVEFLKIAFSHVPDSLDVHNLLLEKHQRLFSSMGLNETHFDIVANHFYDACCVQDVSQSLIDEAAAIITPLRVVFIQGAQTYGGGGGGGRKARPEQATNASPKKSPLRLSPRKNAAGGASPTRSPMRRLGEAMSKLRNNKDRIRIEL
jgi:hemoglobin